MRGEVYTVLNNPSFAILLQNCLHKGFDVLAKNLLTDFKPPKQMFAKVLPAIINAHKKMFPAQLDEEHGFHPVLGVLNEYEMIDTFCKIIYLPLDSGDTSSLET